MEPSFRESLVNKALDEDALRILMEQNISTERVFYTMREAYIVQIIGASWHGYW